MSNFLEEMKKDDTPNAFSKLPQMKGKYMSQDYNEKGRGKEERNRTMLNGKWIGEFL